MSYHVYKFESEGLSLPISTPSDRATAIRFLALYASMIAAQADPDSATDAQIVTLNDKLKLKSSPDDFEFVLMTVIKIMELWKSPFLIERFGQDAPEIWFNYDFSWDGRWDGDRELIFVNAFAKFAKEGAYAGFEGEDNSLWSYVFDGRGGYQECCPDIDWRQGFKKPGDEAPSAPSLLYLAVLDATDPNLAPLEMLEIEARDQAEAVLKAREHLLSENFTTQWCKDREDAESYMEEEEFQRKGIVHIG